jgi:single-stranded-DNA-specific exonuclease
VKKWTIKAEYNAAADIVEQLLDIRGISDATEIQNFLHPLSLTDLFKEFSDEFKQSLSNARKIIEEAVAQNFTIIVHGDYDADGITSTAILFNTLKNEKGYEKTHYFIPNRFEHGYGVSKKSIDSITSKFAGEKLLFITVDSGITAKIEVDYIKSLGHKVIITDHHHKPDELPNADAIVWNDKLVGASVAWIFSKILGSKDSQSVSLAALATITDLQPVLGFNRSIVKKGLEIFNTNPPAGIKELLELARKREGDISTYELGWLIGPRLNASGRLVDANEAVELFTQKDPHKIREIALMLHELNSSRQDKTLEMYALASGYSEENLPNIIISENEEYHEGIIGLVAARLVQKYYRPAIVISLNDSYGKGSVRSVSGINIIETLRNFENLFESLGGHPMAAGFTIKKENISQLKETLQKYALENFSKDLFIPELLIDMSVPIDILDLNFLQEIEMMKPFGLGNEEPLFMCTNVGIIDVSFVGKERQHVVLKFFSKGKYYKGILFNGAEIEDMHRLAVGDHVDIAFNIKKNSFNGNDYLDLVLKDVRIPETTVLPE